MGYLEEVIKEKNLTDEEMRLKKEEADTLLEKNNLDSIHTLDIHANSTLRQPKYAEEFNRAVLEDAGMSIQETLVTGSAEGAVQETYEYRKLSRKEKRARNKELAEMKKKNNLYTIDGINLATDCRNADTMKTNSVNAYDLERGERLTVNESQVAYVLCKGYKTKKNGAPDSEADDTTMREDKQRLHDYFEGSKEEKERVLDGFVEELLAVKMDEKMANRSYVIAHGAELEEICTKFMYLSRIKYNNREYFDNLPESKRTLLDIQENTAFVINAFREKVCSSLGVCHERGEYPEKFVEADQADKGTLEKNLSIGRIREMRIEKARCIEANTIGDKKVEVGLFLARHDAGNDSITANGYRAKKAIDGLKERRANAITPEVVERAKAKGIDPAILLAYVKGHEVDGEGLVKVGKRDAHDKEWDTKFINSYIDSENVDRYLLVENILKDFKREKFLMTSRLFTEEEISDYPMTYAVVAERCAVLDKIIKDPANKVYFDNMDNGAYDELVRGLLPRAQYIYQYIDAVFKKNGYNLATGNYLTQEESVGIVGVSKLDIMTAKMNYDRSIQKSYNRQAESNQLDEKLTHRENAIELRNRYYKLAAMDSDSLTLDNKELVDTVINGYKGLKDASGTVEEMILAELLKKTISEKSIIELLDTKDSAEFFSKIEKVIADNPKLRELTGRVLNNKELDKKAKDNFMVFLYNRVIGNLVIRKSTQFKDDEAIRLRMDAKNMKLSDHQIDEQAGKNSRHDTQRSLWYKAIQILGFVTKGKVESLSPVDKELVENYLKMIDSLKEDTIKE